MVIRVNNNVFFIYLLIVALTTYLIRAIPFSLITKKVTNIYINKRNIEKDNTKNA